MSGDKKLGNILTICKCTLVWDLAPQPKKILWVWNATYLFKYEPTVNIIREGRERCVCVRVPTRLSNAYCVQAPLPQMHRNVWAQMRSCWARKQQSYGFYKCVHLFACCLAFGGPWLTDKNSLPSKICPVNLSARNCSISWLVAANSAGSAELAYCSNHRRRVRPKRPGGHNQHVTSVISLHSLGKEARSLPQQG